MESSEALKGDLGVLEVKSLTVSHRLDSDIHPQRQSYKVILSDGHTAICDME